MQVEQERARFVAAVDPEDPRELPNTCKKQVISRVSNSVLFPVPHLLQSSIEWHCASVSTWVSLTNFHVTASACRSAVSGGREKTRLRASHAHRRRP
jgi:hypothetical protein